MAENVGIREAAAISLIKRAVDLDKKNRKTEALLYYKEGLQIFMEVLKSVTDPVKKSTYRQRASEYMTRAERLDELIQKEKEAGNFHEQIRLEENSTGHSYESLFGRFLDEYVTSVSVDDPYIRSHHQIMNFLRLCELLVKKCPNLRKISLTTSSDPNPEISREQKNKLADISNDLNSSKSIILEVNLSETLHDREIRLSTGWIIKIGRGLDLYKAPPKGRFTLGYFDMDLRPSLETIVDVFHESSFKS